MKLQHLRTFVAVYEEATFTAAAARENATQSGLSMQIKELEQSLGSSLFVRSRSGVEPTAAGKRLYAHAVDILKSVSAARRDVEALSGTVSGQIKVGLMPTFTRAVLGPTLKAFAADFPEVTVGVAEAYSAVLLRDVARGALDFAVVPSGQLEPGLNARHLASDMELFVTGASAGLPHLQPVALTSLKGLKLVLPGPENARRAKIDTYINAYGLDVAAIMELDTMFGTLELVANSDWSTIAPAILCYPDLDGKTRALHPITEPAMPLDYLLVSSSTRALSQVAGLFADELTRQTDRMIADCHRRLRAGGA